MIDEQDFGRILIIKPSAAGDIVSALPVLPALRERYPSAQIHWLVAGHLADLLKGHPMIDEVLEFDRRRFGYLARSWAVTKRFMKFLQRLRAAQYDLVLDFQGLFRSGFLAWTTQATVRVGPAEKRELGWVFYTHRCPPRPTDTHIVDRICTVGEVLGLDLSEPQFPLPIRDDARAAANQMLGRELGQTRDFLAVAAGGTWASKRWPEDKFVLLARKVIRELDLPVVLVGGRAERRSAADIVEQAADPRVVTLAGQTTLSQLVAILDGSRGLVCNDSGPMHMAVALNRPVTAIIGPTNPHRTGPYRRPHAVVKSTFQCAPCYKRHCPKNGHRSPAPCMEAVSVEQVFGNLVDQLDVVPQSRS